MNYSSFINHGMQGHSLDGDTVSQSHCKIGLTVCAAGLARNNNGNT